MIPATNQIVQEFADLLAVIAAAAADNQITHPEARADPRRWEELKCVTETFVACCEEGNFRPLKDKPPGSGRRSEAGPKGSDIFCRPRALMRRSGWLSRQARSEFPNQP